MSLDDPTPLPLPGLDADRATKDAVARPVGGHEAQTPGSGPEHCLRIDRITIGERHRKIFGHIEELAESISKLGLLQPIGVDRDPSPSKRPASILKSPSAFARSSTSSIRMARESSCSRAGKSRNTGPRGGTRHR